MARILIAVTAALLGGLLTAPGCGRPPVAQADGPAATAPPAASTGPRPIRATGVIRAVRVYSIQVPRLEGQPGRITLVRLAPSGTKVAKGDRLAEFDRTKQLDDALEAQAKFDDLSHQVRQKQAQNRADAEKRLIEIRQAEADLERARLQLRKGPILSEIERLQNEVKAEGAETRVKCLRKAHELRLKAEAAALRIVELQAQRQKVALERAKNNAEKLVLRAPIDGMVALQNIWRGGSMGPAQEGDQLWAGQPLMKIFDPSEMLVQTTINEPDNTVLSAGSKAQVRLDAYPNLTFEGVFESASPVANTAVGSPIKNFAAVFRLTRSDPRLLPDLSAAVVIQPEVRTP